MKVGLWCTQKEPEKRPEMVNVLNILDLKSSVNIIDRLLVNWKYNESDTETVSGFYLLFTNNLLVLKTYSSLVQSSQDSTELEDILDIENINDFNSVLPLISYDDLLHATDN